MGVSKSPFLIDIVKRTWRKNIFFLNHQKNKKEADDLLTQGECRGGEGSGEG